MLIKDSGYLLKKSAKNLYGHCRLGRTTSYGPAYYNHHGDILHALSHNIRYTKPLLVYSNYYV